MMKSVIFAGVLAVASIGAHAGDFMCWVISAKANLKSGTMMLRIVKRIRCLI